MNFKDMPGHFRARSIRLICPEAHIGRGHIFQALVAAGAIVVLDEAVHGAPSSGENYELRGLINERMAATEAAIADFRKAIELNPEVSGLAARHLENLISQAANRR